jgi:tRNA threonylcarbamoyladenosine biosynthesis protein TsaE
MSDKVLNILNNKLVTNSEDETTQLGAEFSQIFLKAGDVIALYGDLGSGKTRFVKGICKGLGFLENVTSPSFTIVNEYATKSVKIFHFDFYRVSSASEIVDIGFDDYIYDEGICVIEWADRVRDLLPPGRYDIYFRLGDSDTCREIEITKINRDSI